MTQRRGLFLLAIGLAVAAGFGGFLWLAREPEARTELHTGTPYDTIARLPDWSGAWEADAEPSVLQTDAALPLAPAFAEKLATLRSQIKAGGAMPGNPLCRPKGMPLFMGDKGPLMGIVFVPNRVVFHAGSFEDRIIYTDGRALPDEPPLDYFAGTAVGHWEDDTLAVETTGILSDVELFPGIANGGGLRVKERIHLTRPDTLEDQITLEGPAFATPYSYTRTFTRHRDWEISDYVCLRSANEAAGEQLPEPARRDSTQENPPVRRVGHPAANAASLRGGNWASIATLPDWPRLKGIWDYNNIPPETQSTAPIPLKAPYDARLAEIRAIAKAGGDIPTNNYHCWPRGALQGMKAAQASFFFAYTPGMVTLVPFDAVVRRLYTDGRPHPDKLVPSFNGHSIGHWEGDTLAVDTIGLRGDMQLFNGMNSGGMHFIERIFQIAPDKIQIDTVVESPVSLSEPWHYSRTYTYHPDFEMMEDYCAQNNRDVDPQTGLQTFNLTPPPE